MATVFDSSRFWNICLSVITFWFQYQALLQQYLAFADLCNKNIIAFNPIAEILLVQNNQEDWLVLIPKLIFSFYYEHDPFHEKCNRKAFTFSGSFRKQNHRCRFLALQTWQPWKDVSKCSQIGSQTFISTRLLNWVFSLKISSKRGHTCDQVLYREFFHCAPWIGILGK